MWAKKTSTLEKPGSFYVEFLCDKHQNLWNPMSLQMELDDLQRKKRCGNDGSTKRQDTLLLL
jgi:hypothetical protein